MTGRDLRRMSPRPGASPRREPKPEPRLVLTARDPQERLLYTILAIIAVLLAVYLTLTAWSVLAG